MGEYQEDSDFNELLESDSDDDDIKTDDDKGVNILSLDDVDIDDKVENKSKGLELLFMPGLNIDEDDDDEDDDENSSKADDKENVDEAVKIAEQRKLENSLYSPPPGVDLFKKNSRNENGFKYFTLESLNLESDLDYSRRKKLLGHGFSEERINEMLSDRFEFVRHLFPEAQSVLICDQSDFKAIMNFLFYSISVCHDLRISELMTKAFFDLRKNYGFKWNLTLSHVLTCLLNYGVSEDAVYNTKFYQRHLEKHLEAARKSGQKVPKKYELPPLPEFINRKRSELSCKPDQGDILTPVLDTQFQFCLSSFIQLVTDFSSGQPNHLEFRFRDNWSDQIVLIYILMIIATDKRLINDHQVRQNIMTGIHCHLDSFSSSQWYWGPDKQDQPKTVEGLKDFNHSNVCKSLIILLNEFFPGELCPDTITWDVVEDHSSKVSFGKNNTSDHHLNMIYRLSLIPPSFRGNQLKKYLAFMCLQTVAETVFVSPTHVDVFDIIEIPDLCEQLSPAIRILVKAKNYEVLTSVVEFYDIIIGHEPSIDFTDDKIEAIQLIAKNVLQWIEKKLPGMNDFKLDDKRSIKGIQLSEYLSIVSGRWQSHCIRK